LKIFLPKISASKFPFLQDINQSCTHAWYAKSKNGIFFFILPNDISNFCPLFWSWVNASWVLSTAMNQKGSMLNLNLDLT